MDGDPLFEVWTDCETELVRSMTSKGMEGPEVIQLLDDWIEAQQQMINEVTDPIEFRRAQIALIIKQARLFRRAGRKDDALEYYGDAAEYAANEGYLELYTAIEQEMNRLAPIRAHTHR